MKKNAKEIFQNNDWDRKGCCFQKRKSRDGNFLSLVFLFINASFNIFFLIEGNEIGQSQMECGILPLGHLCNGSNHPCSGTRSRLFS